MEVWLLIGGVVVLYYVFKTAIASSKQQTQQNTHSKPKNGFRVTTTTTKRISTHYEEDDNDLATFRISYGYSEEKSKNKSPGKWIKPGESITIKGQVFSAGNFYFGGQLSSLDGRGTEASLVDESLKIEKRDSSYADESLSYWPKFISLTPKGRGAYLSWLAGSRNDPGTPLGYIFIYFYGLERRVAVDSIDQSVDDAEFKSLFDEILRLKSIYGGSRSFSSYSIRLLELMCLLRPNVVSHPELEKSPQRDSLLFRHRLATIVNNGEPVPAELALAWIRFYPESVVSG